MASLVFALVSPSCFKVSVAASLACFIAPVLVFRSATCLLVSSTILPMRITFSVAFWVSCAWLVAPSAISPTALSTCATVSLVSEVLTLSVSASSVSLRASALTCSTTLIRASLRFATARLICPVSSFLFTSFFCISLTVKSSPASLSISLVSRLRGRITSRTTKNATNRLTVNATIPLHIPELRALVTGSSISC